MLSYGPCGCKGIVICAQGRRARRCGASMGFLAARVPQRWALGLCGALLIGWSLALLVEPPGQDLARYVALTLSAWLVYVIALRLMLSLPSTHGNRDLALIFLVAVLLRIPLAATPPSLSDDIYRA